MDSGMKTFRVGRCEVYAKEDPVEQMRAQLMKEIGDAWATICADLKSKGENPADYIEKFREWVRLNAQAALAECEIKSAALRAAE